MQAGEAVQGPEDAAVPRYQVEGQLDAIHTPVVQLRSGGSIVIHRPRR